MLVIHSAGPGGQPQHKVTRLLAENDRGRGKPCPCRIYTNGLLSLNIARPSLRNPETRMSPEDTEPRRPHQNLVSLQFALKVSSI